MLNKNNIYILLSIFLGFIISYYYNRCFDETFILMFILIALIFYILFYYLADINNKEKYINYTLRNQLEDIIEEEKINNWNYNIYEEEKPINITNNIFEEEKPKEDKPNEEEYINNHLVQEKSITSIPIQKVNGALNININYGSDNKSTNTTPQNSISPYEKSNMNSRIYNNSDWIYGSNAWTDNPDSYIPTKISQPLNQLINQKKIEDNIVSPMMINSPWSEYKSGDDSNPEPYNL